MRRTTWFAVLITTLVLAIAGIIPWMLRAPTAPQTPVPARSVVPVSAVPPGAVANAAKDPISPKVTNSGTVRHAAKSLHAEDQELIRVAVRGGLIAMGGTALAIVIGWGIMTRGGMRRRVITLAGRGLRTAEVARRTGMSQDAVRTLMVPDFTARRRKSVA